MLGVGDVFVYGTSGVCRIQEIIIRDCGTGKKEYYVFQPVFDERSTLYIPTDSEMLSQRIHTPLTKDEVYSMIDRIPEFGSEWIDNDKERLETFKSMLDGGSHEDLIRIIRSMYDHRAELAEKGKKLRSADEAMMQRAEKLLYNEFAYVLGIRPDAVKSFIDDRLS